MSLACHLLAEIPLDLKILPWPDDPERLEDNIFLLADQLFNLGCELEFINIE